jgi:hypothetical protein
VRIPTLLPREYPEATVRRCLDFSTTVLGNLGVADRIKRRGHGLHLVATDISWSKGSGPPVTGTGATLLMAICGRRVALQDLTGPGVVVLADRLGMVGQRSPRRDDHDGRIARVRKAVR